jgi:hypothetical protein
VTCPGGLCWDGDCCTGCWDGSSCEPGDQDNKCGDNGEQCQNCGAGTCNASHQCVSPTPDAGPDS